MPLDPDTNPKAFLTILVAAGLLIFSAKTNGPVDAFARADDFISEAERRFGKLNP